MGRKQELQLEVNSGTSYGDNHISVGVLQTGGPGYKATEPQRRGTVKLTMAQAARLRNQLQYWLNKYGGPDYAAPNLAKPSHRELVAGIRYPVLWRDDNGTLRDYPLFWHPHDASGTFSDMADASASAAGGASIYVQYADALEIKLSI